MAKDYAKVYRGENVMKRGIATYKDEAIFLSQDTLHRDMETLKGRPVVIKHQNVTPENMEEKAVGYVTDTFYNNEAGTFGCKFVIFDDEAKELIRNGYSLSTCYKPTSFGAGGTEINTPYDREVTGLNFTHLALVPDPRYEDAKIYENGVMGMEEEEYNNGWITQKTGNVMVDKDGNETEEIRHIWIEDSSTQSTAWKKWNNDIFKNFKDNDKTKIEYKTRANITDEHKNIINSTLDNLQQGYKFKPIASVAVIGLNEGTLGLCACRENASTISLNPQMFSGKYTQKDYDNSVKSGFHPQGTGDMIKSVLVHEIGHSITVNSNNKEFWGRIGTIRSEYMKNISKKDVDNPDFISNYARENIHEFVAEAFCQGILSKKQGKYTKQVMEAINKHFKKEYQTKLKLNEKEKPYIMDKGDEWVEAYGMGYPLNEEILEKYKKEREKKQSEKQNAIIEEQERKNTMENEKMEIPVSFFDKVMDLICNSKKEKKNEEKEIEDVIDEEKEEEMENKCKKNEVVDKRDIIRQIMAIAGKKEASEDVKTIAKLAEKLAYDKDEAEKENAKEEVNEEYNNDEFFNALELAKSLGEADKLPVPETQAKQIERGKEIFG